MIPRLRLPPPLPEGGDAWVHGVVGMLRRGPWTLWRLRHQMTRLMLTPVPLTTLSEADLQEQIVSLRETIRCMGHPGRRTQSLPDGTLAILSEVAYRSTGLRPYPVQVLGSFALYRGLLVEMATGEGKTLVAGMAAVLAGWRGTPCHVVTANDYLASRDAALMAPLFARCGLSVAAIGGEMLPDQRVSGYQADVVYVTAKELLGDFLRDRISERQGADADRKMLHRWLAVGPVSAGDASLLLVRGLHTALVDEADNVLIDEAVTPLILSSVRESQGLDRAVVLAGRIASELVEGVDYRTSIRQKQVVLRESARQRMAAVASDLPPLWRATLRREELLRQALVARRFFICGQHYIVQEGRIVLLDEYTGRMTPQRTLSAGLHQAIEAHEGLEISRISGTLAQRSFQNFFRQFHQLAGMTGTAREAVGECWQIYQLAGIRLPTHRPCIRRLWVPRVFVTQEEKWQGIVEEIASLHAAGRPILIGTRSVLASEQLADRLRVRGWSFELLNAVRHQDEARIIAAAGAAGRITIATNMAGRGTDIKLSPAAREGGGLHVIISEMHDAGRIDRQLIGRSGRQGDPGSASMFLSLEDELLARYIPRGMVHLLTWWMRTGLWGGKLGVRLAFRVAQHRAEAQSSQRRRSVLHMDRWLESALPFGS
jgi:preprotein translocase subunit SecA